MTTKSDILLAIRQKCLECSCFQPSEVRDCVITACELWPYRLGRDPAPSSRRGFAKPSGYTGDSLAGGSSMGMDTTPPPTIAEPHVYTAGFAQAERSGRYPASAAVGGA